MKKPCETNPKTLTPTMMRGIGASQSLFLLLKKATVSQAIVGVFIYFGGSYAL